MIPTNDQHTLLIERIERIKKAGTVFHVRGSVDFPWRSYSINEVYVSAYDFLRTNAGIAELEYCVNGGNQHTILVSASYFPFFTSYSEAQEAVVLMKLSDQSFGTATHSDVLSGDDID